MYFSGADSAPSFTVSLSPCTQVKEPMFKPPGNTSMIVPLFVSVMGLLPVTITSSKMQFCDDVNSCQEYIVSFSTNVQIAKEEEEGDNTDKSVPSLSGSVINGSVSAQCQAVHSHPPLFPILISKLSKL